MRPHIPDLSIDVDSVDQIALVVEDLKARIDQFEALLGVGPWTILDFSPPELTDRTSRGDPSAYTRRIGVAGRGGPGTEIELIEPIGGRNIYADHLQDHGEGLHHVGCFGFDNPAAVVREMKEGGIDIL